MFTASRLTLARERRGFTKKRLAELTDLSVRMITYYENGDKAPSAATLSQMAKVLRFPESFFEAPDLEEIPAGSPNFRSLSRMTASQSNAARGAGTLAYALHDWVHDRFLLPEPNVPRLGPGLDPETAADVVRAEWGLGEQPVPNTIHLLEAHGVRVFSLAEECAEVDAFSTWRNGTPYVFLNTQKTGEHRRFDAAHELGHLVLHWHHEGGQGREAEREAHAFASAFLMPRTAMRASAPRFPNLDQLIAMKQPWKVSLAALTYRLHKVEALSDWHYRSLYIDLSKRGYRKAEPKSITPESSQILNKVFAALRKEGVSKIDIARELHVYPEELDALVFGLAMLPVSGDGRETSDKPAPTLTLIQGERG